MQDGSVVIVVEIPQDFIVIGSIVFVSPEYALQIINDTD